MSLVTVHPRYCFSGDLFGIFLDALLGLCSSPRSEKEKEESRAELTWNRQAESSPTPAAGTCKQARERYGLFRGMTHKKCLGFGNSSKTRLGVPLLMEDAVSFSSSFSHAAFIASKHQAWTHFFHYCYECDKKASKVGTGKQQQRRRNRQEKAHSIPRFAIFASSRVYLPHSDTKAFIISLCLSKDLVETAPNVPFTERTLERVSKENEFFVALVE